MPISYKITVFITLAVLFLGAFGVAPPFHPPLRQEAPASTEAKDEVAYFVKLDADDVTIYTYPSDGLTFDLPKDFVVSTSSEGEADVVLAKHPSLNLGIRLTIRPFKEKATALTRERILSALPLPVIEDPVDSMLTDGTPALRFSSRDPALRDTRELWFIRNGRLFRMTVWAASTEWLDSWIRKLANYMTFSS